MPPPVAHGGDAEEHEDDEEEELDDLGSLPSTSSSLMRYGQMKHILERIVHS